MNTYDNEWKKIDSLIAKNLPKSALEAVRKIYAAAKKNNQEAQVIKALVYTVNLQQQTHEENEALSIQEVQKEIATSKEPITSILKSYLAGLYWNYFQQERYELYDRTNTVNFNKEDIATWTIEDFHKKISELYEQSLQHESILKQTSLAPYEAIIVKGNVRYLRPTLYDLLAHRALDYFKSDERDIKKPAYAFEINQPQAFAPATEFTQAKFTTNDSLSLQQKALLIYQDLIRFHLKDTKPDALLDVDIERIQYVYQNAILPEKDSLYVAALEHIINQYKNSPLTAQASYLLALYYESQAAQYKPLQDTTHRYDRLKAKAILEAVVKDSSVKNEGWTNSYNLLQQINGTYFSFDVEKVNVPDMPFRSLVQYRNTTSLYFRLIKATDILKDQLQNQYNDKYWSALIAATPVRSWQQTLPQTNDLQEHSVEVKIDALPVGEYILLAAPDASFDKTKTTLGAQLFYISNISYIHQGNQFFVLHRQTGQPLSNANVQLYQQVYDYKTYKYNKVKSGLYQTDQNGFFELKEKKDDRNNNNYFFDITYQADHLFLDNSLYQYYRSDDIGKKDSALQTFFFTDRSLYRPGQTVYFKGIAIYKPNKNANVMAGLQTKVYLQDANGEDIDSLNVTTNEFGSFSGKFSLPQNVLNGEFTISSKIFENEVRFSVEEYKRPKFYVEFNKVKETYQVTDTISITGNAKAYAGNIVDGAKVVYRVVRQPRFIYPWLVRRWWLPPAQPMEITHGITTTNNNGQFTISFNAIPDKTIDPKLEPVFDYRIYADVTDINGETRIGEETVSAGYKSLVLKVNIDERLPVDSLNNISIRTENMNGEYQPSVVTVSISKLIPENRLIRDRYWQQPDQFVMSKERFISYFPHDEYKDESDRTTWPKGAVVYNESDSTNVSSKFGVQSSKLEPGYYAVEVSAKDKNGNEVKDVQYVELYDAKNDKLYKPVYIWTKGSNPIEPSEKTTITIGSAAPDVFVVESIDKTGQPDNLSFIRLNNEKKTVDFSATENDCGGYGVSFLFVKDNRFYQFNDVIQVPWTNKDLQIEYTTFRDKILPGSEEKWSVKISGYKKEAVAAEMLASMYDASLDQFKMHQWQKPDIWPVYARTLRWEDNQNFRSVPSVQTWLGGNIRSYEKRYDRFDFDPNYYNRIYYAQRNMADMDLAMPVASEEDMVTKRKSVPGSVTVVKFAPPKIVKDEEIKSEVINGNEQAVNNDIHIRKNFNETAFFYPDLRTDKDGNITFSFTAPEALTRWKLQTIAHTKDLAFGLSNKEIVTQKELMVQPNIPRFLRQGDHMELSVKIVNLSDKEPTGQVELQLFDATTNQSVDGWFQNIFPNQYFTIAAGQSEAVKFPVEVPYLFNSALAWRIVARAGSYSDGEEAALPILTNKVLITETLPLHMQGDGTKQFTFDKLSQSAQSETLQYQSLTVEYTSNPAWYAVQALPYLMEYPYDCAEQTWNRYYANSLATTLVNSMPRIKQIFATWKTFDTTALLSNLQKNEELKSALLAETPWVLQAKTEAQQKRNIALLFDAVRMSNELKGNIEKLKAMQSTNGGFVWFKGGPDDRYVTQYIVTGIGHLQKLKAIAADQQEELNSILQTALPYLDKKIQEDYENLLKHKADLKKSQIGYLQIQYLYMRSFFTGNPIPATSKTAYNFYHKQSQQYWTSQNHYMQGMIALALNRTGDIQTPKDILKSLKETAIVNEELGMYWKNISYGYSPFWWFAPIETQSLLIEAFSEIGNDKKTVDALKTWLLKNKQTNNWRTTKATADACYALLLQGTNWLTNEPAVTIQLGNTTISNTSQKGEAGTGYFKQTIEGTFVKPEMGNITVKVASTVPNSLPTGEGRGGASWGAVYWQYFEDMDKVTTAATPLQLNKKLFIEKNTDRGPVLTPIAEGTELQVGDKIKVRIELKADRDMEYIHMKDMRASALEPVNVLSGYKWQGGLGYYETTKDASTNFFFNYLPKGTYVFEYPLFVTHAGSFNNGITTIQCMYAPEFSAHSEGVKIRVGAPLNPPEGGK